MTFKCLNLSIFKVWIYCTKCLFFSLKQTLQHMFPRGRRVQTTDQNLTNLVKTGKNAEFHYHIWNHHEKCIQKRANMPGIGSLILEIDVNISEI